MIKSHFKVACRNLLKSKGFALINMGGLAVGMAVAMLIGLWIYDECSFNKYYQHYDAIGRVMIHNGENYTGRAHPIPLGELLRSSFSDDFKYVVMSSEAEHHIISSGSDKFASTGIYMQAEAPEMFTLKMITGSREGLKDPHSVLINQALATKLFGNSDPVGKIIVIDRSDVKVSGVYEDFPDNTEFRDVAFIAPWELYVTSVDWVKSLVGDWSNNFIQIFVQLNPNADFEKISARIKDLKLSHISKEKASSKPELFLHPMSKWHLHSQFENRVPVASEQLKLVWFYGIIGFFVLFLACINFMNLNTARSQKSAREVGVRKAIGSERGQLIGQFLMESFVIVALAFVLCIILAQLSLPWFNGIAGKRLAILWANPFFWLAGMVFIVFTGLLSGSYPAFYLSSFKPVEVLKGTLRVGRTAVVSRKVFVVVQFAVSIVLIIATIIVYRQIQFGKDRPIGYSRNNLLTVPVDAPEFSGRYDLLKNELTSTGVVDAMAETGSNITSLMSMNSGFDWTGKDPQVQSSLGTVPVTSEYGKTVGWQIIEGRDFSKELAGDSSGLIINEAAVRYMGLKHPVGETIRWNSQGYRSGTYKVLGVIKDMVMKSPFEPAYPTVFFLQGNLPALLIRLNGGVSAGAALSKLAAVIKGFAPSSPFEYRFVDEEYAQKFAAEERMGKLAGFFATLAIFISCLGIFGMASFIAEQRTREVGIRKVLGASVLNLWKLLTKDFIILVTISFLIASPVAYYFMSKWVQNYHYRATIAWWIFALAGFGALAITILTVSFQTIRAALANPVRSLRSE